MNTVITTTTSNHRRRTLRRALGTIAAVAMFTAMPRSSLAAPKAGCWSTAYDGIRYCKGIVRFDGGGDFAGPTNRARFLAWAKTGKPKEYSLAVTTGVLRWKSGDCLYIHGAGGNWMLWCGSRAAMAQYALDQDFIVDVPYPGTAI